MDVRPITKVSISGAVLRAYERVLQGLDTPAFGEAVDQALARVVPATRFYVFDWREGERAALRLARYEPQIALEVGLYPERYQPNDPMARATAALEASGDSFLFRVRPSDIEGEDYRQKVFSASNIVERLSLVQRTGDGWRSLNISRDRRAGPCSEAEISLFAGLGQLLLPAVSRHCERVQVASGPRRNAAEIERRFGERFPKLSPREVQVCARAVIGMSVEATALDLDIALTSVLTYRKRAYLRLSVSSPYELACLVLY